MTNLIIVGAALIAVAVGMAGFELYQYRHRRRFEGVIFRYTRKRLARRLTSSVLLIIIVVMITVGVGMADRMRDPWLFNIYWLLCFVLVLALAIFPVMDFIETYKGYRERHIRYLERRAKEAIESRENKKPE